jgi:FlaA1/EpsC-like NDP-sugar epimerase
VYYFLDVDYDADRELVIWGAGKKAKNIARKLSERDVAYRWITDNPKKIGHNIYGVVLEDSKIFSLSDNHDVIIGVSDPKGQREISLHTQNSNARLFWFC